MTKKSILITSCGGPATENVIKGLRLNRKCPYIIGTDSDYYMPKLSSADTYFIIPSAKDELRYINALCQINKMHHEIAMIYPQSDLEVFVCSKWRAAFPNVVLPNHEIIEICQDKGKLYDWLNCKVRLPPYRNPTTQDIRMLLLSESPNYGVGIGWNYPYWIRARTGAGGNKGFVAKSWHDFRNMAELNRDTEWQVVKLLTGRDYSWTSLWRNGELVTSVLKERLRWVYNRIGTTAVQRTIINQQVNEYCETIVKTFLPLDGSLTGIMMIDLKEDGNTGNFYVTEINAGRLGTVNFDYGLFSRKVYKDDRVNFAWLLWKIANGEFPDYPYLKFDALPKDLYYARHIDFSYKIWSENLRVKLKK